MAIRIKVGDTVKALSGDDRGRSGRVTAIYHGKNMVVVEGMNVVKKSVRRSQKNPQGGKLEKEMPVQISTVQFVCPDCRKSVRLGTRFLPDGSKVRHCRNTEASCSWEDEIAPPNSAT